MDYSKEFTHRCNKTHRTAPCCISMYVCKRCKGVCIFSTDFLRKFPTSRSIRQMAGEKHYKEEFKMLRSLFLNEDDEELLVSDNDEDFDQPSKNRQEEIEDQRQEVFELLQKYHTLPKSEKDKIVKIHMGGAYSSVYDHHCKTASKSNKVKTLYFVCSHREHQHYEGRQNKNKNLIQDNVANIYLV